MSDALGPTLIAADMECQSGRTAGRSPSPAALAPLAPSGRGSDYGSPESLKLSCHPSF